MTDRPATDGTTELPSRAAYNALREQLDAAMRQTNKLREELSALRTENAELRGGCESIGVRVQALAAERDALRARAADVAGKSKPVCNGLCYEEPDEDGGTHDSWYRHRACPLHGEQHKNQVGILFGDSPPSDRAGCTRVAPPPDGRPCLNTDCPVHGVKQPSERCDSPNGQDCPACGKPVRYDDPHFDCPGLPRNIERAKDERIKVLEETVEAQLENIRLLREQIEELEKKLEAK